MSARDRYPNLASIAESTTEYPHIREQLTEALNEIDRLRVQLADARKFTGGGA